MDEETDATEFSSVGDRLRAAREEKGFSLEDIAAETRIPRRHLESLEASDWERLPAPTYTTGFAKSYASAVGLDRADIAEQLRDEMGGVRTETSTIETFEPVDPARAVPRWLVFSAIGAILLVIVFFTWMRERSLSEPEVPETPVAERIEPPAAPVPGSPAATPQPIAAQGPVVLTATAPAWIRVTDQGRTLFEGTLQAGQRYQVPPTATAPMLRVGAPEALRVTVGNVAVPPVGPPGRVTSDVSLLAGDLVPSGRAAPGQQPSATQAPQNSLAQ